MKSVLCLLLLAAVCLSAVHAQEVTVDQVAAAAEEAVAGLGTGAAIAAQDAIIAATATTSTQTTVSSTGSTVVIAAPASSAAVAVGTTEVIAATGTVASGTATTVSSGTAAAETVTTTTTTTTEQVLATQHQEFVRPELPALAALKLAYAGELSAQASATYNLPADSVQVQFSVLIKRDYTHTATEVKAEEQAAVVATNFASSSTGGVRANTTIEVKDNAIKNTTVAVATSTVTETATVVKASESSSASMEWESEAFITTLQTDLNTQTNKLLDFLAAAGERITKYETSSLYLNPVSDKDGKITGYSASNGLTLTAPIEHAGAIIAELSEHGASSIDSFTYQLSDSSLAYSRRLAIANATRAAWWNLEASADSLLPFAAEGIAAPTALTLVSMDVQSTLPNSWPRAFSTYAMAESSAAAPMAASPVPIAPGELGVTATVMLKAKIA